MIPDLDEVAEGIVRLVRAGLVPVVAGARGDGLDPHGAFLAAGQG